VYINSGGGIVTDAMAIHDLLKDIQNKGKTVNTIGRGIIASAATYILMAGNNCRMSKNSWFMIHNVGGGVWGDVNMVESYAATLRKFNDRSRDFYVEATGLRKEDITKMMNSETWMTADEAKEKGFIKQIEGEAVFTNLIPKDNWAFANMAVLNSYNAAVKPLSENNSLNQTLEEMKKFWQELGASIMNAIKGVKAPENNDHAALMNSIGQTFQSSFNAAGEQMELVVNEAVASGVTSSFDLTKDGPLKAAFDNAVNAAVTNAIASFDFSKEGPAKVAFDNAVKLAVEAQTKGLVSELEKEITNMRGGKTITQIDEKDKKEPVGSWS
jgi:hypothetical protein